MARTEIRRGRPANRLLGRQVDITTSTCPETTSGPSTPVFFPRARGAATKIRSPPPARLQQQLSGAADDSDLTGSGEEAAVTRRPAPRRCYVEVEVLFGSVSVEQIPLLQLVEVEPELESSSVLPSSVLPPVEVEVLVEHWSLPSASATQVFVSVTQMSLLQLVEVEVEVVPGSFANAGRAPINASTSAASIVSVRRPRPTRAVNVMPYRSLLALPAIGGCSVGPLPAKGWAALCAAHRFLISTRLPGPVTDGLPGGREDRPREVAWTGGGTPTS